MAWDMHQLIADGAEYPENIIIHAGREKRAYTPEATSADIRLRKAVEGLEAQLSLLQVSNDALRAENKRLAADNGRMLLEIETLNVAGTVRAHIVDESTLDVQGVRFVRAGVEDVQR